MQDFTIEALYTARSSNETSQTSIIPRLFHFQQSNHPSISIAIQSDSRRGFLLKHTLRRFAAPANRGLWTLSNYVVGMDGIEFYYVGGIDDCYDHHSVDSRLMA
jgi:hypothetical protein